MITVTRGTLDAFAANNDRYMDEADYFGSQFETFSELAYHSHLLARFVGSAEGADYAAPRDAGQLVLGSWTKWMS